jgi:hypothetical protein
MTVYYTEYIAYQIHSALILKDEAVNHDTLNLIRLTIADTIVTPSVQALLSSII